MDQVCLGANTPDIEMLPYYHIHLMKTSQLFCLCGIWMVQCTGGQIFAFAFHNMNWKSTSDFTWFFSCHLGIATKWSTIQLYVQYTYWSISFRTCPASVPEHFISKYTSDVLTEFKLESLVLNFILNFIIPSRLGLKWITVKYSGHTLLWTHSIFIKRQ